MDKFIGKKLEGRYEITEQIGTGGMADVYKATDIVDNKLVAVKILKKEFAENEEFLRRFRNESKAIALLSHPNIVKVYDVSFSDKLQFIVMEYIDGITLKEYIENEEVLTWKDSVHFIIQILRALQHAHDRGIVHRDIKPQNIMLFTDGTIKVMDFGIAKFAREDERTTDQAIGTVHYISPEQARGDDTDEKSDIYSVGVMLYEMLTGKKPFDTDNPISVAVMHMQNTAERPRSVNPNIPAGLEEIILRAMEKDAEDRYQTAADMIRDIEKFKGNTSMTFGYYTEDTGEAPASDTPTQYFAAPTPPAKKSRQEDYMDDYNDDDEYYDDDEYEDEDDEEEEGESRSLFIPVMTAVTIAFIVVAVFFVLWLVKSVINSPGPQGQTYYMPNLVGMDYYEAKDTYTYLDIQIKSTEYSTYEKDLIFFQDIAADDPVTSGQTVYVNVSLGVSTVTVPDVKGYRYEYALKILEQEGFAVTQQFELSSDGTDVNCVIRTEPSAGEEADSGATITVYVSKGMDTDSIEVPQLVGTDIEEATRLCEYYGLEVEALAEPSLEEEGIVFEQSIAQGEFVDSGTLITLHYSNGEDPSGIVTFKLTVPADAQGAFRLDFFDMNGGSVQSPIFNPGVTTNVPVDVQGTGTQEIVVYLNNVNNSSMAEMGRYRFDFANGTYTLIREDIRAAFESVGAFPVPATEPPTEPPVVEPEPTDPPVVAPPATDPPVVEPPVTDPPVVEPPAEETLEPPPAPGFE